MIWNMNEQGYKYGFAHIYHFGVQTCTHIRKCPIFLQPKIFIRVLYSVLK